MKLSGDVAIFRLEHGKANAIDLAMLDKLDRFVDDVGAIGARAAVITGYDRFFSSGLALPSIFHYERDEMRSFINRFSEVMLRLYTSPFPLVAAVNGHAIAGGCVLALMADHRIMCADAGKMGLNEVQLGIGLPAIVIEPLRARVPAAAFTQVALHGRVFLPTEALAMQLVDKLVNRDELDAVATKRAQALADLVPAAFQQIKNAQRRPVLETLARVSADETERWLDTWFTEGARRRIAELIGKLTR